MTPNASIHPYLTNTAQRRVGAKDIDTKWLLEIISSYAYLSIRASKQEQSDPRTSLLTQRTADEQFQLIRTVLTLTPPPADAAADR